VPTLSFSNLPQLPRNPHNVNTAPQRRSTYPGFHTSRRKPRRWPLVLRITKGSVHSEVVLPILFHSACTAFVVCMQLYHVPVALPGLIIPSLSIVVGLMLVFRNNACYDRFWQGRNHFTGVICDVRGLARTFLVHSRGPQDEMTDEEHADIEKTVNILLALLYAIKNSLRAEFLGIASNAPGTPWLRSGAVTPTLGAFPDSHDGNGNGNSNGNGDTDDLAHSPGDEEGGSDYIFAGNGGTRANTHNSQPTLLSSSVLTLHPEYSSLVPPDVPLLEDQGLALPIELAMAVESYVRRGLLRQWWAAPQAAQLTATLNSLTAHYGAMETIKATPIPVAHLIHTRQVLALYMLVLPFGLVDNMGWWSVPVVALVTFTLYGIEGIGRQLEDPFGYDRNDIKMDAIVEDLRVEIEALLDEWRRGFRSSSLWR